MEAKTKTINNPVSSCYGVTNKCHDSEYVLFADYDGIYLHTLFEELSNIHEKFKDFLTNFAIFESSESIMTGQGTLGSYHVISFAKLPYHKMREILSYMSVDDDFFKLPKRTAYRSNTLRISPKYEWVMNYDKDDHEVGKQRVLKDEPKFVCWFPEVKHKPIGLVSLAHLKAYQKFIENFTYLDKVYHWKFDKKSFVELKKYHSGKG